MLENGGGKITKQQKKELKIVSLQALDALVSQQADPIVAQKFQENFDGIINQLSLYNVSLVLHAYFDFLGDFIKVHYSNFTVDNLQKFLTSLVERIQKEMVIMET
jgi:hypothetical protein